MIARFGALAWLVLVWVALWERLTLANVVSGVLVAALLMWSFPLRGSHPQTGRLRPLHAVRFIGYFFWKLLQSNLIVAWEVITPNNEGINEGIVAVPITSVSDTVVTIVANAISLTPGTLTIEIDRGETTVLYVHVLHLRDIEKVRLDLLRLELMVVRAIGKDAAVAAAERHVVTQTEKTNPRGGER